MFGVPVNARHAVSALALGAVVFVAARVALTSGADTFRADAQPSADASVLHGHERIDQHASEEISTLRKPAERPESATPVGLGTQPLTRIMESPPGQPVGQEERQFKWLRETTDVDHLQLEFAELEETLHLACRDEAFRRLADGEYEILPPHGRDSDIVSPGPERRYLVEYYAKDTEGRPVRMTIPESGFPNAYSIKRQLNWINDLIHRGTAHD